jgi:hypothetical protein
MWDALPKKVLSDGESRKKRAFSGPRNRWRDQTLKDIIGLAENW